jgi:hypothetical protein
MPYDLSPDSRVPPPHQPQEIVAFSSILETMALWPQPRYLRMLLSSLRNLLTPLNIEKGIGFRANGLTAMKDTRISGHDLLSTLRQE